MTNLSILDRLLVWLLRPLRNVHFIKTCWNVLKETIYTQTSSSGEVIECVTLPAGNRIYIDLRDQLGCLFFEKEPYESVTTQFIQSHLLPGETFVDIGANFGYFTILASHIVGERGKVVAFEANPTIRNHLNRSVSLNFYKKRVVVAQTALSDKNKKWVNFYLSNDPKSSGISSLFPWKGHLTSGALSLDHLIKVPTTNFDYWIKTHHVNNVSMIKIDVEGAEMPVLRGMQSSLKKYHPKYIICETSLESNVTVFLKKFDYTPSVLEYHIPNNKWGNILFTHE